jgi:L-fuculose-phosphate aldolase
MTFLNINHRADAQLREQIISTALKMNAVGINTGKSGNVSARSGDGFLITPTGIAYEYTEPEQIVAMRFDGSFEGDVLPSSEWRFHADIYRARRDVGAIVHTHAAYATTLACMARDIPAFHYMVAIAGGSDIRCAPYATFGTQALSDHAVAALDGRHACLLAQHGMIAVGATLEKALAIAVEIETLSQMYWQALQIGEPAVLSEAEMKTVLEKFRTYGQQPKP